MKKDENDSEKLLLFVSTVLIHIILIVLVLQSPKPVIYYGCLFACLVMLARIWSDYDRIKRVEKRKEKV